MTMRITVVGIFAVLLVCGCVDVRTITLEEFQRIDREAKQSSVVPQWQYVGTADGFHYIAPRVGARARYRLPMTQVVIVEPRPYERRVKDWQTMPAPYEIHPGAQIDLDEMPEVRELVGQLQRKPLQPERAKDAWAEQIRLLPADPAPAP